MTTRGRTPLTLLIAGLAALALVGCGVEAKDAETSTGPGATVTTPTTAGPTTTEADTPETTEPDSPETTETTEADTPETTEPSSGTTLPSGMEDQIKDQMITGFKQLGLTDEQASCLADAYLEEFGTGASANPDYTKMLDLFTDCDIDPTKIGTGG